MNTAKSNRALGLLRAAVALALLVMVYQVLAYGLHLPLLSVTVRGNFLILLAAAQVGVGGFLVFTYRHWFSSKRQKRAFMVTTERVVFALFAIAALVIIAGLWFRAITWKG